MVLTTLIPHQIILSFISDKFQMRGPVISFNLLLSGIGYSILLGSDPTALKTRYGAIFLSVMGTYTAIPLTLSWSASNAGCKYDAEI